MDERGENELMGIADMCLDGLESAENSLRKRRHSGENKMQREKTGEILKKRGFKRRMEIGEGSEKGSRKKKEIEFVRQIDEQMTKKRNRGNKEDRLSSLPDDLLVKILNPKRSCKTAIRCSTLSQGWMGLYKRLPCLYLDEDDLYNTGKDKNDKRLILDDEDKRQIVDLYIPKMLACKKIDTFSMEVSYMSPMIFRWCLESLVTYHKVKNLSFVVAGDAVYPPLNLFGCQSLVTFKTGPLSLGNTPRDPLGFPNLMSCDLAVDMDNGEDVQRLNFLIGGCPVLQNLRLILNFREECPEPLLISSDTLTNLDFGVSFEEVIDINDMALKIRIDAPELLTMRFCSEDGLDYSVEARVQAPKLMEFAYAPVGKGILSNVRSFKALKFIHLVEIDVRPVDICMKFAALPMLEKLAFTDCRFEKDQKYFEKEKGIMARLTEVSFTNKRDDRPVAEEEMYRIFLQATPNLKRLHCVLKNKVVNRKNAYVAIFKGLSSPADSLDIKESCEQVELTILRNHRLQEHRNG